MDKIDKQLKKYKTLCCDSEWYRNGRADYRCSKCNKDVTLEIIFMYQALKD